MTFKIMIFPLVSIKLQNKFFIQLLEHRLKQLGQHIRNHLLIIL